MSKYLCTHVFCEQGDDHTTNEVLYGYADLMIVGCRHYRWDLSPIGDQTVNFHMVAKRFTCVQYILYVSEVLTDSCVISKKRE